MAAIKLLQDVVYADNTKIWCEILESRRVLNDYFARIGLTVTVDEANGFAYLRQLDLDSEDIGKDYSELPQALPPDETRIRCVSDVCHATRGIEPF